MVGAVVAFGVAELVHGLLYESVPSVFASLVQGVIELTPGELVTRGIEILGTADIPTLISSMIIGALVVAALLANIALRSPIVALIGVAILGSIAAAATLAQPFAAPVLTIAGALAAGATITELLLRAAGLRAPTAPEPSDASSPVVRSREAYSSG